MTAVKPTYTKRQNLCVLTDVDKEEAAILANKDNHGKLWVLLAEAAPLAAAKGAADEVDLTEDVDDESEHPEDE